MTQIMIEQIKQPESSLTSLKSKQVQKSIKPSPIKPNSLPFIRHLNLFAQPYNWIQILTLAVPHRMCSLTVSYCQINAKQITDVLVGNKWSSLKVLKLDGNFIGYKGVRALCGSNMPHLQTLSLFNCRIGQQGIKQLTKFYTPNLLNLNISDNHANHNSILFLLSQLQAGTMHDLTLNYRYQSRRDQRINLDTAVVTVMHVVGCASKITGVTYQDVNKDMKERVKNVLAQAGCR